jgi:ADP-dependent NAD(P)H-hydrate dehydratase
MTVTPLDERYLRLHPLPTHSEGDKHSRGRVLVIAGHLDLPGPALLAGLGALRSGAGVLRIATCRTNAPHLAVAMPEAMVVGCWENSAGEIAVGNGPRLVELSKSSDAVLIGPGMLDESSVGQLCSLLLKEVEGPTFVLDAAAFTSLRKIELPVQQQERIVCTPHFGEMAKFLQRDRHYIERNAFEAALEAACRLGAVIALKGSKTHIVSARGDSVLNEQGTIGLATSGSGDTLAGILAGLTARGASPFLAAAWAVYLHAAAGRNLAQRIGHLGLLARELPAEIPALMRDISG